MGEEARFATWVLGSTRSGVVAVDGDGAVVLVNDEARRILDLPAGSAEASGGGGSGFRELLADQPELCRKVGEVLAGRGAWSRSEVALSGPGEATPRTVGFSLEPVFDPDDPARAIRGAVLHFRDLTPIERADEQKLLRDRLAALGQMAAGFAHEIRNPLAGMEVLAGLLKRRLADRPEEIDLLDQLSDEIKAVAATVTESLAYVRPISIEREPVDLGALLETSLDVALRRVPFDGEIRRNFASGVPKLLGDVDQLGTALANVLLNALEAMADHDAGSPHILDLTLEVDTADGSPDRDEGREISLTVSDTGPGVPDDLRDRVFYPFFTNKERGSGVGLASAQKIVAGHGGSIQLASRNPFGCTVRVSLPCGEELLPAAAPEPPDRR